MNKVALSLLPLAIFAGCARVNVVKPEGVQLPPLEFPLRSFTYPSGLRVLVEHDDRTQLAGVFLVVGSGSTADPAGKEGLAHYIEHLAFRSRPTGHATVWTQLDTAGAATFNAFTSFDDTVFYEVGLASHLTDMLQLEGRRMLNPVVLVTDAERATELDVVRNELRLKNETGYVGEVLNDLQAAVYPPGHPYARAIGGTHESMETIKRADVDAYVREHYKPENMTLLILGNVDLASADKLLAEGLPHKLLEAPVKVAVEKRMPDAAPVVPESPPAQAELSKKEASVTSPEIWIAWTMPRAFDANSYLASFVAGVSQGRLQAVMQDDKDIANVGVNVVPGKEASMLLCVIQLHEGEHPQESLDRVLSQVPKIWNQVSSSNTVGEVGFGRARRAAVIREVSDAQDLAARGLARVTATHFAGDPTLYSRTVRQLTEMRQQQVNDYASPYITRERARAILFVPPAGTTPLPAAAARNASGPSQPGISEAHPSNQAAGWENERLQDLLAEPKERSAYRLPNGLSVLLERRTGLPLLTATIMFPAIAATPEEVAAANLLEDAGGIQFRFQGMMAGQDSEALLNGSPEAIGASIRSAHTDDHIAYSIEGASGNADLLLALLGEYPRTVSIERNGLIGFQTYTIPWIKRAEKEPREIAERQFNSALLAGSPYGIQIGSKELEATTQAAATDWLKRTHTPANATLVVVGDFDLAAVKSLVADSFGNWQGDPAATAGAAPSALAASGSSEVQILVTPRAGATQSELTFGCLLPEAKDGETSARHSVAAHVLSDRLWNIVRVKLGATYGIGARAVSLRGGTSYLELTSAVESTKLGPVLAAIKSALGALREEVPTADDVAWAKIKYANGRATSQMKNSGVIASALKRAEMNFAVDGPGPAADLSAVTAEEIRADFQSCMQGRPILSIVGDEPTVQAALKEGWK